MKRIIIFSILISVSCSLFPSSPDWILNRKKQFPYEKYISSTGEGSTRDSAKNHALAGLASYFEQRIEASVKSISSFESQNESFIKREGMVQTVTAASAVNLFLVQYTDFYFNKRDKNWYICAYIDRDEVWKIICQKLDLCISFCEQCEKSEGVEKDPFKKIILLKKQIAAIDESQQVYYMALSVCPELCEEYTGMFMKKNELNRKLMKLKQENAVFVFVENDCPGEIKAKFESIMGHEGFLCVQKGARYVLEIQMNLNEGCFKGIYSCEPQISVILRGPSGIISSFSAVIERLSAYNEETLRKLYICELEKLLDERFLSELF